MGGKNAHVNLYEWHLVCVFTEELSVYGFLVLRRLSLENSKIFVILLRSFENLVLVLALDKKICLTLRYHISVPSSEPCMHYKPECQLKWHMPDFFEPNVT